MFGSFVPRAHLLGHLEQIDSYAPGHQVRFGSLNYVTDIHGDLIFNGFETASIAPLRPDKHGLNLPSGHIQEIAPVTTLALDPEQIESPEDGKLNPITEATDSAALEPHTDSTSHDICIHGAPDSPLAMSSGPCESADNELDRLSIFKFRAADVFQHSPMGDVLH